MSSVTGSLDNETVASEVERVIVRADPAPGRRRGGRRVGPEIKIRGGGRGAGRSGRGGRRGKNDIWKIKD